MLPVCSAAPSSSPSQISYLGGLRTFGPEDRVLFGAPNWIHTKELSFRTHATEFEYVNVVERPVQSGCIKFPNISSYISVIGRDGRVHQNTTPSSDDLGEFLRGFPNEQSYCESHGNSYLLRTISGSYPIAEAPNYIENLSGSGLAELLPNNSLGDDLVNELTSSNNVVEPSTSLSIDLQSASESLSAMDAANGTLPENPKSFSATLNITNDLLPELKENAENLLSGFNNSVETSIDKANSFVQSSVKSTTELFENAVSNVLSSVNNSGDLAGRKLMDFASGLKGSADKAGSIAVTVLRKGIVAAEESLANATTFVVYSYKSVKNVLPLETQNVLNLSEKKTTEILRPFGTAFQQAYTALEGLEKDLGLDPNDPILPFLLFLGTSTILGYGGYSGDLSPKLTFELLKSEENAVLIDVRPEDLRERDGIPDLRRGARFRYASIALPKMDDSLRKLLKSGKEVDDALIAAVIRNLKIVKDSSKVIIMDANGAQSKGIARSLRKLGVKRPYLVQGGFSYWVANGLRVKALKPETTLTILNEETEAILEDIKPTPVQFVAYSAGLILAIYALAEWEKTLQFIGLIGLGQTIYRRVASYEDSEDLKEDVRLLLAPARIGAQAISWAAEKLGSNGFSNGLPTSPSSTAVQDRVLQAAAKHGSQPSDLDETQDQPIARANENLDLTEA